MLAILISPLAVVLGNWEEWEGDRVCNKLKGNVSSGHVIYTAGLRMWSYVIVTLRILAL